MSDHPADEPEKDRTFTAVVVIGVALTLALGVWKDGRAAPDTAPNPKLVMERLGGVKVRLKGSDTVFTCVVLERGNARHLLLPNGKELLIPRGEEIEILDGSEASEPAQPAAEKKVSRAKPAARQGQGLVINTEGEAFKGRLSVTAESVVVTRGNGDEVSIPMADVRWHKFGVDAPDNAYWQEFGELPIKGYRRPGGGNSLKSKAVIAFSQGDWSGATRAYMNLLISGEKEENNLRHAVRNWTGTGGVKGPSRDREQALNELDVLFRPHRAAHPLLTRIQAQAFLDMAQDCLRAGQRKAAVSFAERLRKLGADYAPAAQKVLDQAR